MGDSLFGKLRGVFSRETTSDISGQNSDVSSGANLARIGLAMNNVDENDSLSADIPQIDDPAPATGQPTLPASGVDPVGIQFFAELPSEKSAQEISSVSQQAENCLSSEARPAGDGVWSVAVTLKMAPVPHEIYAIESVLQTWAQKLGGAAKGWGLSQNQAA